MKLSATLAGLAIVLSLPASAADPTPTPAEIRKMQEVQAKLMAATILDKKSRLGFNETVNALQDAARKRGWKIGEIVDVQAAMLKAGKKDAKPFKTLALCKTELAEKLIKEQIAQKVMPFAPCQMSVVEGGDGKVHIVKPNTEAMAQLALPVFAPILKQMAEEEKAVLAGIVAD
jgi:uncharacterized protein (DUF302 family)